jgi:hypothetical protein
MDRAAVMFGYPSSAFSLVIVWIILRRKSAEGRPPRLDPT